jgi:hypothetical protein
MTAFEDFVNTELPQRATMLTSSNTGGFTGDPNGGGAPAKVQVAPKGTWFLDDASGDLWQKLIQTTPTSWTLVGGSVGSGWQDDGTFLRLINTADNVTIGGTTDPGFKLHVQDTVFPVAKLERTGFTTDDLAGSLVLKGTSATNRGDGFGSSIQFRWEDDTSGEIEAGVIGSVRDGSDTDNSLVFYTSNGGSPVERWRVKSNGSIIPSADTVYDIGSPLLGIRQVHASGFHAPVTFSINTEFGGTVTQWTIDGGGASAGKFVPGGSNPNPHIGSASNPITRMHLSGYSELSEIAAPAAPSANFGRLYVKDVAGVTRVFLKTDVNDFDLTAGSGGSASTVSVFGLTTTGLAAGDCGYVSADNTISLSDSSNISTARFHGVNDGVASTMIVQGVVVVNFVSSLTLTAGDPVYLSTTPGKATNVAPISGVDAQIGIVQDASTYVGSQDALVLIQVKSPVQL